MESKGVQKKSENAKGAQWSARYLKRNAKGASARECGGAGKQRNKNIKVTPRGVQDKGTPKDSEGIQKEPKKNPRASRKSSNRMERSPKEFIQRSANYV